MNEKKISRYINDDLETSSDDSDEEVSDEADKEASDESNQKLLMKNTLKLNMITKEANLYVHFSKQVRK